MFTAIRKLMLIVMISVFSQPAAAVGLGKLKTNSRLGEPLDLDIELLSISDAELGQLVVALASPSRYVEANLPYPEIANQILFEVTQDQAGNSYVKVKTLNPVTQSILPLLIKLSGFRGSHQRVYIVLLNPIGYDNQVVNRPSMIHPESTSSAVLVVSLVAAARLATSIYRHLLPVNPGTSA